MKLTKKIDECAFQVASISGEVFFIDTPELDLDSQNGFLEIPIDALALVTMPPTAESKGQPTEGLIKVEQYKQTTSPVYIGQLGIAMITSIKTDSPMGKAILGSRSGIIM